jgi:hypothetical protein
MLPSGRVATDVNIRHAKAFANDLETCIFCGLKTIQPIELSGYTDEPGVICVVYECVACGNYFEADFHIKKIKGSERSVFDENE